MNDEVLDPEGDNIFYMVDWGDGSEQDIFGPYNSGEDIANAMEHQWSNYGEYGIRVKAKDIHGAVGNWSDPFMIYINHSIDIDNISGGLLDISVDVTNPSEGMSQYMNYSIKLFGGSISFFQVNKVIDGQIFIKKGSTDTIHIRPPRTFGKFTVTVTLEAPGYKMVTKTVEGFGIFFYFIILQ